MCVCRGGGEGIAMYLKVSVNCCVVSDKLQADQPVLELRFKAITAVLPQCVSQLLCGFRPT